jgi:hypothetical protein
MKFTSQICTTEEQSKRLLALGLRKKTADMYYSYYKDRIGYTYDLMPKSAELGDRRSIPAWSLDRLICMISDSNTSENYKVEFYTKLNRYDEAIALIQSLIHIGQFNKEYLT